MQIGGVYAVGNVLLAGAYYPVTSYAFLFRSTDNGVTWGRTDSISLKNHEPSHFLWTNPTFTFWDYGSGILIGVGGGMDRGDMYRSTDNGMTWTDNGIVWPESGEFDGSENIECFCGSNGNIFAGTLHGVFISANNGATWKGPNTGLALPISGMATDGTHLFAATESYGIFRSTDEGSNWVQVDTAGHLFVSMAATRTKIFSGAFQAYERPSTGGVFVSTDNGGSWARSDSGLTNHELNVLIASGPYLYAGTNSGVFRSTDEGTSWTVLSTGLPVDWIGVESLAVSNSELVIGTHYGVWCYPL